MPTTRRYLFPAVAALALCASIRAHAATPATRPAAPATAATRPTIVIDGDNYPTAVEMSPDGRVLAVGLADNTLHLFDAATGAPLRSAGKSEDKRFYYAGPAGIHAVAFDEGGKRIATGGWPELNPDDRVKLWDAGSLKPLQTIDLPDRQSVDAVAFSHDGRRLAVGGSANGAGDAPRPVVVVFDLKTGRATQTLVGHAALHDPSDPGRPAIVGLGFRRGDAELITAGGDGTVRVWDVRSDIPAGAPRPTREFKAVGVIQDVAVSADGRQVAWCDDRGVVSAVDLNAAEPKAVPLQDGLAPPGRLMFVTGGRLIGWGGHRSHTLNVWGGPDSNGSPLRTNEFKPFDGQRCQSALAPAPDSGPDPTTLVGWAIDGSSHDRTTLRRYTLDATVRRTGGLFKPDGDK